MEFMDRLLYCGPSSSQSVDLKFQSLKYDMIFY